jgi:putative membrane-bound dehydrogenase-like protein
MTIVYPRRFTLKSILVGIALAIGFSLSHAQEGNRTRPKEAANRGLPAAESLANLAPGEGLTIDLIASEPLVEQPSFLRFDERGRLWMVQYRQYPTPAGLEIKSRDTFWRNTYDQVPAPPGHPNHVPGADLITIHEDSDGDGTFDQVKTFVDGLSLVTSVAWDRDGVWVLQPPYLLFYHDENQDDIVEGPPEVHLRGFGIEDSHSIASSLNWGPDGWLYGSQGSTVTAAIEVTGRDDPPIKSVGQLIWRYHPEKRIYEIFAEGGSNMWSCQFDSLGRLYAGTNEGGKLGYHFMQGSYNRKNFGKHGELSNPHAYDYFNGIEESTSQRVTTNLLVYDETSFPERYHGSMITTNPLAGRVFASELVPQGPTFHAKSIDLIIDSDDRWFRPVYADTGPDGALYIADWYDSQINHMENHEGRISPKDGRVYRVRSEGSYQFPNLDLRDASTQELAILLRDERRWYRDTARRLINQRQDKSILPTLQNWLRNETGQTALEALWAINLLRGFESKERQIALSHTNPHVRKWAIRLIADDYEATDKEYLLLANAAASDPNIEVRQQLASSAKRLQTSGGLEIVKELLKRGEDAQDRYIPSFVWWAMESFASSDPQQVVSLFEDSSLFTHEMVQNSLLSLIMRRLAAEGSREYLREGARLLGLAPDQASKDRLLAGFEEAYRGRSMTGLPEELLSELSKAGGGSLAMQLRQQIPESLVRAKAALTSARTSEIELQRIIETLGEVPQPQLLATLLERFESFSATTQEITLSALRAYDDPRVGIHISGLYSSFPDSLRTAAQTLLSSRSQWAIHWMGKVKSGTIAKDLIPPSAITSLRHLGDPNLNSLMDGIWTDSSGGTDEEVEEINRLRSLLYSDSHTPDPYHGKELYNQRCAACHTLHSEGGNIGPELTGYQRQDLQSLLVAILRPNAEIREGYENYLVKTKDGQTLAGFIADQDEHVIVLRPAGGQPVPIDQSNIESLASAGISLMPPGLLTGLDPSSLTDLFSYIQSSQPLFKKRQ